MNYHRKGQRRPAASDKALNRASGLASALNRECVREILERSTPEEITSILEQVGYRIPANRFQPPPAERAAALKKCVDASLASDAGRREFNRLKNALLNQAAQRWLTSDDAATALNQLKAQLLAPKVCDIADIFERACREALARQVTEWLQSASGREAVEQARTRALQQEVKPKRPSWTHRVISQAVSANPSPSPGEG